MQHFTLTVFYLYNNGRIVRSLIFRTKIGHYNYVALSFVLAFFCIIVAVYIFLCLFAEITDLNTYGLSTFIKLTFKWIKQKLKM